MESSPAATRFARLTRPQALLVLVVGVAGLAWCLADACATRATGERRGLSPPSGPDGEDQPRRSPEPSSKTSGGDDLRLYRRIVERVHAGENYYDAAGDELRERGYPTGSVFNWRPPTYAWMLGLLPGALAMQIVLNLLALAALLLVCDMERREGSLPRAAALALLLVGVFSWCVDGEAFFAQELWAAVLLTLSLGCYARGWWLPGFVTGLAALFFRELALPYVLVAAFLAYRKGRRREVVLWAVGLALYALFMTVHAAEVSRRLSAVDRVEADGWVQFGGPNFVLATVRMNAWLFNLPRWAAALYLVLALVGLVGWRDGARAGLTAAAYVIAFAVVGKPVNDYWGLLAAPLLALGVVHAPAALRDLFRGLALTRIMSAEGRELSGGTS